MSVFRSVDVECPGCGTVARVNLVLSVNADRRPDLRDAIVDGSFQRFACASCGTSQRIDPAFTYVDLARKQYVGVWPTARRGDWQAAAAETQAAFENAYGKAATGKAKDLGAGVQVRAVFGWPALVEKILAAGAGIDDRTLELLKILVMRRSASTPVPGDIELRLSGRRWRRPGARLGRPRRRQRRRSAQGRRRGGGRDRGRARGLGGAAHRPGEGPGGGLPARHAAGLRPRCRLVIRGPIGEILPAAAGVGAGAPWRRLAAPWRLFQP